MQAWRITCQRCAPRLRSQRLRGGRLGVATRPDRPLDRLHCRVPGRGRSVGLAATISVQGGSEGDRETTATQVLTAHCQLLVLEQAARLFCCAGDRREGCACVVWPSHSPSASVIARRATAMGARATHDVPLLSSRACHMLEMRQQHGATPRMSAAVVQQGACSSTGVKLSLQHSVSLVSASVCLPAYLPIPLLAHLTLPHYPP